MKKQLVGTLSAAGAGVLVGAKVGAGTGIALGPLGAIAGTIPGMFFGGVIGALAGNRIAFQMEVNEEREINKVERLLNDLHHNK